MTEQEVYQQVRTDAVRVRQKWPSSNDLDKAHKAFAAYDLGFKPLIDVVARVDTLKFIDKLFGVGERHVRRVETIRHAGAEAKALEAFAKSGWWSLEAVEHIVNRGVNIEAMELLWRLAPAAVRAEFLGKKL